MTSTRDTVGGAFFVAAVLVALFVAVLLWASRPDPEEMQYGPTVEVKV